MLEGLPTSTFDLVGRNGEKKGSFRGVYSSDMILIDDASAHIEVEDELRRRIANGTEETFEVVDPVFYEGGHGMPSHFQVAIKRKGTFRPGTGGNYTIHVTGNNARVNLHSSDNSVNTVVDNRVFANLRSVITEKIQEEESRRALLQSVDDMEALSSDKSHFLTAYQRFIASAAGHMTILAPFLPALATYLG